MKRTILILSLCIASLLTASTANAAKIHQLVNAVVYHNNGEQTVYDGSSKISMPRNREALQLIVSAHTKQQKKEAEISLSTVDSVTVWLPERPECRHTLVYLPDYGWSALIDRSPKCNIYLYESDGFRLRGDGGLWRYGKETLIVDRDGKCARIKDTNKMSVEKFAKAVTKISEGDKQLESRLKYLLGKEHPDNYVTIVKFDGDTISGYLHSDAKTVFKNMFSKSGSILQYINISEEPKGKATRFSADDVREIRWYDNVLAPNIRVSIPMHYPIIFKIEKYIPGFVWLWDSSPSGSIVKWESLHSTGGQNPMRYYVNVISAYLEGSRGAFVILYDGNVSLSYMMMYLKKQAPDFYEMVEDYYGKSPDAKAHCNELKNNPSTFLNLYDKYLLTHAPIDDKADVKIDNEANEEPKK